MVTSRDAAVVESLAREVRRRTGVTINPSKAPMLLSRVARRVRALDLEGPEAYLRVLEDLEETDAELEEFIDVVTTHKTSFFRTPRVWRRLWQQFGRDTEARSFDAWSCACSIGHEPFGLAAVGMAAAAARPGLRWSVLATDVSPKSVERASQGLFDEVHDPGMAAVGFSPLDHFERTSDGHMRASPALRSRMKFQTHNLMKRRSGSFDVALLRNVLIYFEEDDKRTIVENVLSTIRPGGLLVIGESESLLERDARLEYLEPCIFRVDK